MSGQWKTHLPREKKTTSPVRTSEGELEATIPFTKEEWVEIIEAVASKANEVRHGAYDDGTPLATWAEQLDMIHGKLVDKLENEGIRLEKQAK